MRYHAAHAACQWHFIAQSSNDRAEEQHDASGTGPLGDGHRIAVRPATLD
ncbi:hypothetical protein [Novosphingobium sp.]